MDLICASLHYGDGSRCFKSRYAKTGDFAQRGDFGHDEPPSPYQTALLYIKEKLSKLIAMERALNKRNGRIYLDFLQNRRGQTLAAPYCVRPKKGASVSAPREWNEIKSKLEILNFTIKNMAERVENLGDLFLPVLQSGIDMEEAMGIWFRIARKGSNTFYGRPHCENCEPFAKQS